MRLLLVGIAFMLIALAFIHMSRAAQADPATHVFQISCLPEVDLFEVRSLTGSYEPTGVFDGDEFDLTGKGYVLYAPERHADFSGSPFPIAEGINENPNYGIHSTRFECRLHTDSIELVVWPDPSVDLAVNNIAVTLRVSGRLWVEDLPFNPHEDRGPITSLVYDGEIKEVIFNGKFGGIWPKQMSPNQVLGNLVRTFPIYGGHLNVLDLKTRILLSIMRPLRAEDIDYHIWTSEDRYELPIKDYRYRGPGAPAERLIAR